MPDAFYDVHLMISHPLEYAEPFIKAGATLYNFHLECEDDIQKTLDAVKALGCKVGLTIKPGTAPEALVPYLDQLDLVLVMSAGPESSAGGGRRRGHCHRPPVRGSGRGYPGGGQRRVWRSRPQAGRGPAGRAVRSKAYGRSIDPMAGAGAGTDGPLL